MNRAVVCASNDFSFMYDDRSHRHFTFAEAAPRLPQSLEHELPIEFVILARVTLAHRAIVASHPR